MGGKLQPIVKKYTFSKDEQDALAKVEMGLIAFEQAIMGMEMNKNILLRRAYSRCGIEENAQEGYNRTITYDLETSEITVNLTPKDEVEPKI